MALSRSLASAGSNPNGGSSLVVFQGQGQPMREPEGNLQWKAQDFSDGLLLQLFHQGRFRQAPVVSIRSLSCCLWITG